MIPRLPVSAGPTTSVSAYLDALRRAAFSGDLDQSRAARIVGATDNSIYEIEPAAIVYPRSASDIQCALAGLREFPDVTICPRGGGTGTNGQSLHHGVVLETARWMTGIGELQVHEDGRGGTIRVEPGVVLDRLNARLADAGLQFAPMVSTSDRATIGGMIGTDAAGKGSCLYGRTSDHVVELDLALADGTAFTARRIDGAAEVNELRMGSDRQSAIARLIDDETRQHRALIAERFPRLVRFMTGYNLAGVTGDAFIDLNRVVAGAEGSLAVVTGATLRVVPLPAARVIVAVGFDGFDAALGAATLLATFKPAAIETMDEMLLELARTDATWSAVRHLIEPMGPEVRALHLVEFFGDTPAEALARGRQFAEAMGQDDDQGGTSPVGVSMATSSAEQSALWSLRKRAVGLLGNLPGARRPVAFVEDCAVPPERLQAFIRGFRAILDEHGLRYGMFGHVDAGCLHVRPALDLLDPDDVARLSGITDQVATLALEHGGVLWGEHGKGFRGAYNPLFFGETLYEVMRRIKKAFDPENRLNPGKMATAAETDTVLLTIEQTTRGVRDRAIAGASRGAFAGVMRCNGNGACFSTDPASVMCPSSRQRNDRLHSPKGRAMLLRAWLEQLSEAGCVVDRTTKPGGGPINMLRRIGNTVGRAFGADDLSHDVHAAMEGCLACKACATQCPVHLDVPDVRSCFLELYHGRYLRPLRDFLIGGSESALPKLARWPRAAHTISGSWPSRAIASMAGMIDPPQVAPVHLAAALAQRNVPILAQPADEAVDVILVPDAFTWSLEPEVVLATIDVLQSVGMNIATLPCRPSGKSLHVRGFRRRFRSVARQRAQQLREFAAGGVPLVGLDPALTLVYRDEYPTELGEDGTGLNVQLLSEWLPAALATRERPVLSLAEPVRWFGHCTERTAVPESGAAWREVFACFGLDLETVATGCCGMCGAFGHERIHKAESRGIWDAGWGPELSARTAEAVATGYSCREQGKRFGAGELVHPMQLLWRLMRAADERA